MADTTSTGSSSYPVLNADSAPTYGSTSSNSASAQASNLKDTVVNSEVRRKNWHHKAAAEMCGLKQEICLVELSHVKTAALDTQTLVRFQLT